jgi:hypothetical protein
MTTKTFDSYNSGTGKLKTALSLAALACSVRREAQLDELEVGESFTFTCEPKLIAEGSDLPRVHVHFARHAVVVITRRS